MWTRERTTSTAADASQAQLARRPSASAARASAGGGVGSAVSTASAMPAPNANVKFGSHCCLIESPTVAVVHAIQKTTSVPSRSEEHTSEVQSQSNLVCRLL